jgi:hypothetical protein
MDCEDIIEISLPGDGLAACVKFEAGEIGARSGGAVLTGNPLGIIECQRAGLAWQN